MRLATFSTKNTSIYVQYVHIRATYVTTYVALLLHAYTYFQNPIISAFKSHSIFQYMHVLHVYERICNINYRLCKYMLVNASMSTYNTIFMLIVSFASMCLRSWHNIDTTKCFYFFCFKGQLTGSRLARSWPRS